MQRFSNLASYLFHLQSVTDSVTLVELNIEGKDSLSEVVIIIFSVRVCCKYTVLSKV